MAFEFFHNQFIAILCKQLMKCLNCEIETVEWVCKHKICFDVEGFLPQEDT